MSASSRAAVALILTLLGRSLRAQSAADSGTAGAPKQISRSSDAPRAGERTVEQPVIDAARLVRERGVRDLSDLLTDRVPGMLVVPGSGLTDMGSRIRVRGVQTLVGDRAPVVFVDGMRMDQTEDDFEPVSNGAVASGPLRLDDLNPEDVESIEVVEGPASAAVYGPGAAAGVLLIHTKRGRPGPPRWEAYATGGVAAERTSWPANFGGVDRDNPDSLYRSGLCSLFAEAAGWCVQDFVQQFNPLAQRSPFRTALRRDYGLSLSGGSGFGDYRLAGDFEGDGGLYSSSVATSDPNYYRRVNVRVSGSIRPWPSLDIRGSGAYLSSNLRFPPSIPLLQTVFGPSDSTGFTWNPFFQHNAGTQALERPFGFVEAHWTPLSWLTLRGLAGTDKVDLRDRWVSSFSTDTTRRLVVAGHRETLHRTLELGASATHALSGSVRLRATLGVQHLRSELNDVWPAQCSMCPSATQWERQQSLGYYFQGNIGLRERVFVTAAVRHDHFDATDASTTYPSVGVSWLVRAVDSASFSLLRLRAAYGSAGLEPSGFPPLELGFLPLVGSASPLEPERARSFELGADAGVLGGRFNGAVTFYDMRSFVVGFGLVFTPSGCCSPTYQSGVEVMNRGIEAMLTAALARGPALGWDVSLSLWGNRNRLLRLNGPPVSLQAAGGDFVQRFVPGYPVGGYWTWPILSYSDANGDGIITASEVKLGPQPVWAGTPYPTQGAALTSQWALGSRFRAAVTLDYRAGQTLFNETAWRRCLYLVCRALYDRQTPLAEQAQAEVTAAAPPGYFEGAAYLKLRELSLSFDAPSTMAAVLHAHSATITLAGRDLATWSGYSGADPESGSYGTIAPGQPRSIADYGTLPVPHSWTLRLQLAY